MTDCIGTHPWDEVCPRCDDGGDSKDLRAFGKPWTDAGIAFYEANHWRLHAPIRGCVEPCSVARTIAIIEDQAYQQGEAAGHIDPEGAA